MPNWCDNKLTITGPGGVRVCLDAIKGVTEDDGPCHIDFQRIVPMPAILDEAESGSLPDKGRVLLGDDELGRKMLPHFWVQQDGITDLDGLRNYIREHNPNAEEAGRRSIQAEQETGCRDWYEWRAGTMNNRFSDGHWGTKWNASYFNLANATDTLAEIGFLTAWSPPIPVVIALSKQFPTLTFTLIYFEPGMCFAGEATFLDGKGRNRIFNHGGKEYTNVAAAFGWDEDDPCDE